MRYLFLLVTILSVTSTSARTVKKVVDVNGNCRVCKTLIEGTVRGIDGVISTDWNIKARKLAVIYNDEKTTIRDIEEKIAAGGFDTQHVKASNKDYYSLPESCRYRSHGKKDHTNK
jgi:mercuric ion binding protein